MLSVDLVEVPDATHQPGLDGQRAEGSGNWREMKSRPLLAE